ncbi:unnamed protein product, partial [Dovyalis caffra]
LLDQNDPGTSLGAQTWQAIGSSSRSLMDQNDPGTSLGAQTWQAIGSSSRSLKRDLRD